MEIDQDLPALQRIQRLVRELGVSTTFLYLVDRLLRRVSCHCGFNYYIFMAQDQHLWVADGITQKFTKFDLTGKLIEDATWGTFGGLGQVARGYRPS